VELAQVKAVITGGARGIGAHVARALVSSGARVVAGDVDAAALRRLRDEVPGIGVVAADVASEAAVGELVGEAHRRMGGVNVLINNAGILRDGRLVAEEPTGHGGAPAVRRLPLGLWQRVLDVNLTGAFLMAREVSARLLADRARGVIVNVSSLARAGNPGQSAYAASKAALDACTRTWALELAPHGIRVGGVAPGVIDTPIVRDISDEAMRGLLAGIPVGHLGATLDVWRAIQLIIECEFFTGRTIEIDGGARMG
jgi:3-oxoacyl-[acyl-carrier protein] reductase